MAIIYRFLPVNKYKNSFVICRIWKFAREISKQLNSNFVYILEYNEFSEVHTVAVSLVSFLEMGKNWVDERIL